MTWEPERLDDQRHITENDPGDMLVAVASAAAQVRTAYRVSTEAGVDRLTAQGRPRAIVVAGMGAAAIAGDILRVVCGNGAPLPIVTLRSYQLPGWVGATDLVIAVSCSGRTEETLAAASEAVRRGCSLLGVGASGSPLESIAKQASAPYVAISPAGQPRANLWLLVVPLIVAAASLGLARADADLFERVAAALEDLAHRCRPSSESFINPGKVLAMELAETVPMIWGSSSVAAVAGHRLAAQLNQNAKYPAISGELPAAAHDQLGAIDGPFAERDIYADTASRTLRLVMLRDVEEHPRVARRRELSVRLAHDRDVPVTELVADGVHPLERVATLIGLGDFATTYLAIGYGIDPTPVSPITELTARISQ